MRFAERGAVMANRSGKACKADPTTSKRGKRDKRKRLTVRPSRGLRKRVSQVDAAVMVLQRAKEPMDCYSLVQAMAAGGLWKSPAGKTPHITLFSEIMREIRMKGSDSRFVRTEPGKFTLRKR